jgi:hypothetical protein
VQQLKATIDEQLTAAKQRQGHADRASTRDRTRVRRRADQATAEAASVRAELEKTRASQAELVTRLARQGTTGLLALTGPTLAAADVGTGGRGARGGAAATT